MATEQNNWISQENDAHDANKENKIGKKIDKEIIASTLKAKPENTESKEDAKNCGDRKNIKMKKLVGVAANENNKISTKNSGNWDSDGCMPSAITESDKMIDEE